MQFGIFSVSDITTDPVSGQTPSETERIGAIVQIAQQAEEVGLDVFAIGEHHNPPFFSSAPTTLLAFIAATTRKLIVSTATTLITTNDPVRIAEDYAMLQHLSKGRMDLMLGRGNTAPVYPWFGHYIRLIGFYRQRYAYYGHGTEQQAIVGLGGQAYIARNSQDAKRAFRPYFDEAPVYGHGPSMEDFMDATPLSVGSPQEVIDKTLTFREHFGVYQRQLFLMDHAGLPLKTVLDQLDLLGGEVVPVLRKEIAARQDPQTPEAPTHASLVTAKYGDAAPRQPRPNANRGDNLTGTSPYQDSDPEIVADLPLVR